MEATLGDCVNQYLEMIRMARSENTFRTYKNGLQAFQTTLAKNDIDPSKANIQDLTEEAITWFATDLKSYAPATEQLYLTAATGFYKFLVAENLRQVNLPRLQMLVGLRARRSGRRLPQFPRDAIESLLEYAQTLPSKSTDDPREGLRNLRDQAFLLTLADTGLRVHEACKLRRGEIDWNEGKALLIGKGDSEAIVRFSQRVMLALRVYLNARAEFDGGSGRPLGTLPLFARHDKGAGKKIKPISTATGRNIVNQRVLEHLGPGAAGTITPHSFRHYFVTTVLVASGGNLKLAQELARHQNITVTQRYAHLSNDELDQGYHEIFEKND